MGVYQEAPSPFDIGAQYFHLVRFFLEVDTPAVVEMRVCVQSQSSPFFNFEDPTLRMVDRQGASLAGARVAHCRHIVHLQPGEQS